jgi:hypothetical protein
MYRLLLIALFASIAALPVSAQRGFSHNFAQQTETGDTTWRPTKLSEGTYPKTYMVQLKLPITADTCTFTLQGALDEEATKDPFDLSSAVDCLTEREFGIVDRLAKFIRGSLTLAGLAATASDCTDAEPISVTTTADHGYATGDKVTITGVTGNTACNVTNATITKVDADEFTIDGTTGDGTYSAGGAIITVPTVDVGVIGSIF